MWCADTAHPPFCPACSALQEVEQRLLQDCGGCPYQQALVLTATALVQPDVNRQTALLEVRAFHTGTHTLNTTACLCSCGACLPSAQPEQPSRCTWAHAASVMQHLPVLCRKPVMPCKPPMPAKQSYLALSSQLQRPLGRSVHITSSHSIPRCCAARKTASA